MHSSEKCVASSSAAQVQLTLAAQVNNITTLKSRFGEQALQGCDVMLKDLEDSQRVDERVHEQIPVRRASVQVLDNSDER